MSSGAEEVGSAADRSLTGVRSVSGAAASAHQQAGPAGRWRVLALAGLGAVAGLLVAGALRRLGGRRPPQA